MAPSEFTRGHGQSDPSLDPPLHVWCSFFALGFETRMTALAEMFHGTAHGVSYNVLHLEIYIGYSECLSSPVHGRLSTKYHDICCPLTLQTFEISQ